MGTEEVTFEFGLKEWDALHTNRPVRRGALQERERCEQRAEA